MVNPDLKPDAIAVLLRVHPRPVGAGVRRSAPTRSGAARPSAPPARRAAGGGTTPLGIAGSARGAGRSRTFPPPRRPRDLALLRRHHRPAQGGGADATAPSRTPRSATASGVLRLHARTTSPSRCPSSSSATRPARTSSSPSRSAPPSVLFPDRCTAEVIFEPDRAPPAHHPDQRPDDGQPDGEPPGRRAPGPLLPAPRHLGRARRCRRSCYERWEATFGVELLDGLGTAEMWHIFISNRPGTCGRGRWARWCPASRSGGRRGGRRAARRRGRAGSGCAAASRAIGYWQQMEKTRQAFRGEWVVSGDLVRRDADGYFTYCGRGRRHAQGGGQVALAAGGRELPAAPPRGARGGGRRRGRRAAGSSSRTPSSSPRAAPGPRRRSSRPSCASGWSRTRRRARWCFSTTSRARTWGRWTADG